MAWRYQFLMGFNFIGKPFPADSLEDAVDIVLRRHFRGWKVRVDYRTFATGNREAGLTIAIPGRKKVYYRVMQTGLKAKE